jgi:hypothetical protein
MTRALGGPWRAPEEPQSPPRGAVLSRRAHVALAGSSCCRWPSTSASPRGTSTPTACSGSGKWLVAKVCTYMQQRGRGIGATLRTPVSAATLPANRRTAPPPHPPPPHTTFPTPPPLPHPTLSPHPHVPPPRSCRDDETGAPTRLMGFDVAQPTARNKGKVEAIATIRRLVPYNNVGGPLWPICVGVRGGGVGGRLHPRLHPTLVDSHVPTPHFVPLTHLLPRPRAGGHGGRRHHGPGGCAARGRG